MKTDLNVLRVQSLEQSRQLAEREKIDSGRFHEMSLHSKIAAWAGVVAVIIMIAQWWRGK